jgi:hypothetical protein
VVGQDHDPAVVRSEAELGGRTQHPVGHLAAHLAGRDLHSVGHRRADRREWYEIPDRHVERATAHLQGLTVTGVDLDQLDAVGIGVRSQLEHLRHDDAVETLAEDLDLLDRQAEIGELLAEVDGVTCDRGELLKPREKDLHAFSSSSMGWSSVVDPPAGAELRTGSGTGRRW